VRLGCWALLKHNRKPHAVPRAHHRVPAPVKTGLMQCVLGADESKSSSSADGDDDGDSDQEDDDQE
jgi:hypothetical protein